MAIASRWSFLAVGSVPAEHTTAESILDQLLHHATIVVTDGVAIHVGWTAVELRLMPSHDAGTPP
ncbi:hypothetical protein HQ346_22620 [Rhodococcus sp. BP-252]|uniref:hypothetical protein n=1 Tax=unclassified Rhodococcus (in: high G+C Gram-positive bacteria) TaxID=192944 RepID=UPI001C9A5848|nr:MULTISPECIES: hypothetical protein [unclassified Rhodococcus (in: high G+C Gram-positive bacteria)]MBY6414425.1 hypothetical protein [Rhodococcus sp. BP-320]MBY6419142.1 hypothetical protein [Rhodococcus sp. BP-321]MBY6423986.1 hypothetical protein [Rhodococcus sp. BP-324]MBY6429303.1 hypothetical protein [Rhodococcus sp. BP-323]MBY6434264.1 hypothetical protein [Rhodococcus sp. BP-322]